MISNSWLLSPELSPEPYIQFSTRYFIYSLPLRNAQPINQVLLSYNLRISHNPILSFIASAYTIFYCFCLSYGPTMVWLFVSPQNLLCWTLMPKVIVFRGETFGRWLGHNDGALVSGISDLIKESPESSLTPSTCKDTAERCSL